MTALRPKQTVWFTVDPSQGIVVPFLSTELACVWVPNLGELLFIKSYNMYEVLLQKSRCYPICEWQILFTLTLGSVSPPHLVAHDFFVRSFSYHSKDLLPALSLQYRFGTWQGSSHWFMSAMYPSCHLKKKLSWMVVCACTAALQPCINCAPRLAANAANPFVAQVVRVPLEGIRCRLSDFLLHTFPGRHVDELANVCKARQTEERSLQVLGILIT